MALEIVVTVPIKAHPQKLIFLFPTSRAKTGIESTQFYIWHQHPSLLTYHCCHSQHLLLYEVYRTFLAQVAAKYRFQDGVWEWDAGIKCWLWDMGVTKITFSPFFRNSMTHQHLELLFCSISEAIVQKLRFRIQQIYTYSVMDATPINNAHPQLAASCRCATHSRLHEETVALLLFNWKIFHKTFKWT